MSQRVHIAIYEPSTIIRRGIISILKRLSSLDIDIAEIAFTSQLSVQIIKYNPNILIISPSNFGLYSIQNIKNETKRSNIKFIALQNNLIDPSLLKEYDEVISIYDSIETITEKLKNVIQKSDEITDKQELSNREKDVVIAIVKGMTNKQIADELKLSTHTIMTHRRNITNKLKIHSSSGLTIYAIVNKLIDITDIQ